LIDCYSQFNTVTVVQVAHIAGYKYSYLLTYLLTYITILGLD